VLVLIRTVCRPLACATQPGCQPIPLAGAIGSSLNRARPGIRRSVDSHAQHCGRFVIKNYRARNISLRGRANFATFLARMDDADR
jgi:hypothetical protein